MNSGQLALKTIQIFSGHNERKNFDENDKDQKCYDNPLIVADDEISTSVTFEMEEIKPDLSVLSQQKSENKSNFMTVETCSNGADILEHFESIYKKENPVDYGKVLLIKFVGDLIELSESDLRKLNTKCYKQSLVILLESKNEEVSTIYWKLQNYKILTLKPPKVETSELDRKLNEFFAEFLADSVKGDHLGLISKFSFQSESRLIDLNVLADSRDFNLLLLAAEQGNIEIVKVLLQLGMNTTSLDNKVNAQTLAMNGQHFDVLHVLLLNNLKFPEHFNVSECTGKLKDFCNDTEEVHKLIRENQKEELEKILQKYKNLRHFYNFSNESSMSVAIKSKSYEIYEMLAQQKFRFASHENPKELMQELEHEDKKIVREIHLRNSEFLVDKHINVLVGNSFIYHDEIDGQDKQDIISRAYKTLNSNSLIRIVLMIVAASKNFKIIFDFNRESVDVADPTVDSYTQGLFYVSGRIYIGAKQLLNSATEHETLANLAHELCHFAMNLVYNNDAKPYKSKNLKACKELEKISQDYQNLIETDDIVDMVYSCYPPDMYHAELIVRVVHFLAFYSHIPEKLQKVQRIYFKLFEFYEKKIVPELEQALPEIEKREEREKEKEISKFKKFSIIGGILSVIGVVAAICVGLVLYTPTYKFEELSVEDRMTVIKAPIIYKNENLEFRELFPENSTAYVQLTSDHISQMLRGDPLNFSDPHLHYLDDQVSHSWINLTEKLEEKFLASNFTFQNESLKVKDLYNLTSSTFESLRSDQIIKVLDSEKLLVHEMIKNETKFYDERKIFDESIYEVYSEYVWFLQNSKWIDCVAYNNSKSNETFEDFYDRFVNQSFEVQFEKVDKIKNRSDFSKCGYLDFKIKSEIWNGTGYEWRITDTLYSHELLRINFDQVLKVANETKMFILSDEAGTGKTVTFEQFTMRIKRKLPTRWVSYIDLKDHKDLYNDVQTLQDVKRMLSAIFGLSSENEFELKVFEDLFDSGNVILLWNGFDEISPEFSEDVIRISMLIKNETQNIQFLCTRPLYSKILRDEFKVRTYTLVPFDKEGQNKFVEKFFISENIEASKIPNFIKKVQKIINSTASTEDFSTPLMLGMIAELVANDVEIFESENLYQIYERFVSKKIKIWKEKNEFADKFLTGLTLDNSGFNMMDLYQSYALKSEFRNKNDKTLLFYASSLKIMHKKIPKELTNDEISRMGILYINGPKDIKFAHKTFSEFFATKFIFDKLCTCNEDLSDMEAESRAVVSIKLFQSEGVQRFFKSFIESEHFNKLEPYNLKIVVGFVRWAKYTYAVSNVTAFIILMKFFKNDLDSLKTVLRVDEDKTLYTRFFNYADQVFGPHQNNPTIIKAIVKPLLSDEDFAKFISGRNQKGIILFSSYYSKDIPQHDLYVLNETLRNNKDPLFVFESIVQTLTIGELKLLLEVKNIWEVIYIKANKFSSIDRLTFDQEMWNVIEQKATKTEQKEILFSIFVGIWRELDTSLNFKLNITSHLLSSTEILKLYSETNILYKMIQKTENLKLLWEFLVNHTNEIEQKEFLRKSIPCVFYICVPVNFLTISIWVKNPFMIEVYESFFEPIEIKDIFHSQSANILVYFLMDSDETEILFKYLENLSLKVCEKYCFEKYNKRKTELELLG